MKYNYGDIGTFTDYFALISNLPVQWKTQLNRTKIREDDDFETKTELEQIVENNVKVASKIYWLAIEMKEKRHYDHGKVTWQSELKIEFSQEKWQDVREYGFKIAMAPKLKLFQYKLLSRKLATNVIQNRWDATVSPKCSFCSEENETIVHIIWSCKIIQQFWKNLIQWIRHGCKFELNIGLVDVVINRINNKQHKYFIESVILLCKQYIYASKCLNQKLNIQAVVDKIYDQYLVEKLIAQQNNKVNIHNKKWKVFYENVVR